MWCRRERHKAAAPRNNMKLRYFRHPFLDTGRDLQTRRQAEAFLAARGYRIAPVTLDAWDWMYAGVYETPRKRGDTALQDELTRSYLSYSDQVFEYSERLAKQLSVMSQNRSLLLHGNQLEADHIGELLDVMRKRGYHFIALADALARPGLWPARHLYGRRRHRLARPLGDRAGQASARSAGISAMGD